MLDSKFLRRVPLPEDLTNEQIFLAMQDTQNFFSKIREKTGICLGFIIQANNFSGVVSNVFTVMLGNHSHYKPYSDQRYPDLMHENKQIGLEVKASNKPFKGGEGHNGHTGWHIVVCFNLLDNGDIEFVQVEIANLNGYEMGNNISDWKYQGSSRNDNDSQRTETYVTTNIGTAKLRDGSVYFNHEEVKISKNLISARNKVNLQIPYFSIFSKAETLD